MAPSRPEWLVLASRNEPFWVTRPCRTVPDPKVAGITPTTAQIAPGGQATFTSAPYTVTQADINANTALINTATIGERTLVATSTAVPDPAATRVGPLHHPGRHRHDRSHRRRVQRPGRHRRPAARPPFRRSCGNRAHLPQRLEKQHEPRAAAPSTGFLRLRPSAELAVTTRLSRNY